MISTCLEGRAALYLWFHFCLCDFNNKATNPTAGCAESPWNPPVPRDELIFFSFPSQWHRMTRHICSVTHGQGTSHACERHRLPRTQPLGSFLEAQVMQEMKQIHARGSFESCNLAWKNQNINDESVLLLTVLETKILSEPRASFSRLSPLEFCFYT